MNLFFDKIGLRMFLQTYPGMIVRPSSKPELRIEGQFEFVARSLEHEPITDCYHLSIVVPLTFPRSLPTVEELDQKIPRIAAYHVNKGGSLCLGSRLRLLVELNKDPSLEGFANNCLVPYLFAVSHKLRHRGKFPFGELPHGESGELLDYVDLFGLHSAEQARMAVRYLSMKKRRANKLTCPCGCNRRLGVCRFNRRMTRFRRLAERTWFRSLAS